jgi:putative DNA primase/helicase
VNTSHEASYTTTPMVRVAVEPDGIHGEMTSFDQWIAWKAFPRNDGRLDKVPYNVRTGDKASSTDSRTWSTFAEALYAYAEGGYDGIGFVFSSGDPFTGIDLDHCRDPETGVIAAWVAPVIDGFETYTEVSPSGEGIHIYVKGRVASAKKGRDIEVYSTARFFTVTGVRP